MTMTFLLEVVKTKGGWTKEGERSGLFELGGDGRFEVTYPGQDGNLTPLPSSSSSDDLTESEIRNWDSETVPYTW